MPEALARNSVQFNTRHNVHSFMHERDINSAMADGWFERLVAALEADGRGMRALSLAAKCGPNYIQQMISNGKRPTVDKLLAILDVLGEERALEILIGTRLSKTDIDFIQFFSKLDPSAKDVALSFFRTLLERQQTQVQSSDFPEKIASRSQELQQTQTLGTPLLNSEKSGTKKEQKQ